MGYYDGIAEGYDELHGEEQLKKLRIIAEHLKVNKDTKLLDVGCGTGLSAKVFNCDITGIDPSKELLKQCSFPTKQAYAENIPFPDNYFDVVIAVTCIHNFKDAKKALEEIKRVGKDKFAITILKKSPKKDFLYDLVQEVFSSRVSLSLDILEEQKDLLLFLQERKE